MWGIPFPLAVGLCGDLPEISKLRCEVVAYNLLICKPFQPLEFNALLTNFGKILTTAPGTPARADEIAFRTNCNNCTAFVILSIRVKISKICIKSKVCFWIEWGPSANACIYATVTLTFTRWPWHTNLTQIFRRCAMHIKNKVSRSKFSKDTARTRHIRHKQTDAIECIISHLRDPHQFDPSSSPSSSPSSYSDHGPPVNRSRGVFHSRLKTFLFSKSFPL